MEFSFILFMETNAGINMVVRCFVMIPHNKKAVGLFPALGPCCKEFARCDCFCFGSPASPHQKHTCEVKWKLKVVRRCLGLFSMALRWAADKTSGFWSLLGRIASRGEANIETLISDGFATRQRFQNWTLKDGRTEDTALGDRKACGRFYDLKRNIKESKEPWRGWSGCLSGSKSSAP